MPKRFFANIFNISLLLCVATGLQSRVYADAETAVTVKSDANIPAGYVALEPLPSPGRTNTLMKHLNVSNLDVDQVLGYVTSANYGDSVEKFILYGYLPLSYASVGTQVQVEYFGQRINATVVQDPLFDPHGKRMKS